jgi:hypothetical protein
MRRVRMNDASALDKNDLRLNRSEEACATGQSVRKQFPRVANIGRLAGPLESASTRRIYFPGVVEPRKRSEQALVSVM